MHTPLLVASVLSMSKCLGLVSIRSWYICSTCASAVHIIVIPYTYKILRDGIFANFLPFPRAICTLVKRRVTPPRGRFRLSLIH